MKIMIGNDHGGFAVKGPIVERLKDLGHEVIDVGCHSEAIVRYPHYARKVAGAVARGEADRGILLCSTGIGMSVAANKVRSIRAALVTSTTMARMTRRHNDSNVLCLGGRITGLFELLDIVETWLAHDYEGGRHAISLGLIDAWEQEVGLGVPDDIDLPVNEKGAS
ncbi:MAG: ribose 5-phosphate isomerase B [Planctomycetes bacterium]|nr:ribose 5-phosphate isomerase B [Planctomycetota bacterium]